MVAVPTKPARKGGHLSLISHDADPEWGCGN